MFYPSITLKKKLSKPNSLLTLLIQFYSHPIIEVLEHERKKNPIPFTIQGFIQSCLISQQILTDNHSLYSSQYWHSVSLFAGDVKNPKKTYPRAMFLALAMVTLSYFIPVLVATGATTHDREDWVVGFWGDLAGEIG